MLRLLIGAFPEITENHCHFPKAFLNQSPQDFNLRFLILVSSIFYQVFKHGFLSSSKANWVLKHIALKKIIEGVNLELRWAPKMSNKMVKDVPPHVSFCSSKDIPDALSWRLGSKEQSQQDMEKQPLSNYFPLANSLFQRILWNDRGF